MFLLRNALSRLGIRNLYRLTTTTNGLTSVASHIPKVQVMKLHDLHTKGDQELVTFLKDEIVQESKGLKSAVAKNIGDFQVTSNNAEVVLQRKFNDETVKIRFNVNHTVDSEVVEDAPLRSEKQEQEGEMRSKPNFDVDIQKGNQTLTFNCSFIRDQSPDPQEEYSDLFLIDELALYEGEFNEQTYAVAGDILDGYLYDLFMNMLEDRGITNEFVQKLSDFSTEYEHQLYVGMLKSLQEFVQKK